MYSEIFKLKKYDLDDFDIDEKKKEVFISELKAITDNYNNYVTDNIVFDKSKRKEGNYLPGSHIPVLSEDCIKKVKPDFVIIFPWNIKKEIIE